MSNVINSGVKTDDHLQLVYSDGVFCGKLCVIMSALFRVLSLCYTHHR